MRILMLGNSLTASHGLPDRLAALLGAEVVAHTRGGARLAEQLNPETKMGAATTAALAEQDWDYVVLQEMSIAPVKQEPRFQASAARLAAMAQEAGAVPVLFETWAYAPGSIRLEAVGLDFDAMSEALDAAYRRAQEATSALLAPVGKAFQMADDPISLYAPDGRHPSEKGTCLAAGTIADTIAQARA